MWVASSYPRDPPRGLSAWLVLLVNSGYPIPFIENFDLKLVDFFLGKAYL